MASAPVRADGRKPAMMRQMKTERVTRCSAPKVPRVGSKARVRPARIEPQPPRCVATHRRLVPPSSLPR